MKLRSWSSAAMVVAVVGVTLVVTLWPRAAEQEVGTAERSDGSADSTTEPGGDPRTETGAGPVPSVVGPLGTADSTARQTLSGTVREVGSVGEWEQAVASAQPGDELRLVADIDAVLAYRGDRGAPSGTPANPIVITAAPGVWIDPGDRDNGKPALDVRSARHVWVDGVRVRGSQFGIRFLGAGGSSDAPARLQNSVVTDIGDACVHLGADTGDWQVSSYVIVESNDISRCGAVSPRFGEGVYVGYGKEQWVDETHDITVRNNEIYDLGSEAVDIKTGSRNVIVEDNFIHDVGGIRGGVITAHYGIDPNPSPDELDLVVIRRNRIWNVNLDDRPESNDWAIWVGHGGVQVTENRIWNLRGVSGARAIRVRAEADFGPHPITISDNLFWSTVGWEATGSPSGSHLVDASGNTGPAGSGGIEETFEPGVAVEGEARSSAGGVPGSLFDPVFGSSTGPTEPPASPPDEEPASTGSGTDPVADAPSGQAEPPSTEPSAAAPPSPPAEEPASTGSGADPVADAPSGAAEPPSTGSGAEPVSDAPSGLAEPSSPPPAGAVPSPAPDAGPVIGSPPGPEAQPSTGSNSDPVPDGRSGPGAVPSTGSGSEQGSGSPSGLRGAASSLPGGTTPAPPVARPESTSVNPIGGGGADQAAVSVPTSSPTGAGTNPPGEVSPPRPAAGAVTPDGSLAEDRALSVLDYPEVPKQSLSVAFITLTIIVAACLAVVARATTAPLRDRR